MMNPKQLNTMWLGIVCSATITREGSVPAFFKSLAINGNEELHFLQRLKDKVNKTLKGKHMLTYTKPKEGILQRKLKKNGILFNAESQRIITHFKQSIKENIHATKYSYFDYTNSYMVPDHKNGENNTCYSAMNNNSNIL